MNDVSALVLAGGKATRFGGIAKHELVVDPRDGRTILQRQTAVLEARVAEILVSAPAPVAGYRTVHDAVAGVGPLAGIAAGLAACTTDWLLVVAGDMPYLSSELVDALIAARAGDAVGVRVGGLPEPLVCVLHRRTLTTVQQRIARGAYKASGLLTDEGLAVVWVDHAHRRALRNVNSPEDL